MNYGIPPIIVQTWKTRELPSKCITLVDNLKSLHPDWTYILSTDEENEKLVKEEFPQYYEVWKNLPKKIQQVDAIKYMLIYKWGGFYIDLDMNVRKNLDALRKNAKGNNLVSTLFGWKVYTECAWFASTPRHPFWLQMLEEIVRLRTTTDYYYHFMKCHYVFEVVGLTGPLRLGLTYHKY